MDATKLDEGTYAFVRRNKLSLYVRDARGDYDDTPRYNQITVGRGTSLTEKFKLPIPWERVFKDTPYTESDAKNPTAPKLEQAKMLLHHLEYDGYGKEWKGRQEMPDSFRDQLE